MQECSNTNTPISGQAQKCTLNYNQNATFHQVMHMCYMDVGLRKLPLAQISDDMGHHPQTTVGVRKLD